MNDDSFDQEISALESEVSELTAKNKELRQRFEADEVRMARYFHLIDAKERLERENAALEGKPYRDENDPYAEPPQPPDDMEP